MLFGNNVLKPDQKGSKTGAKGVVKAKGDIQDQK